MTISTDFGKNFQDFFKLAVLKLLQFVSSRCLFALPQFFCCKKYFILRLFYPATILVPAINFFPFSLIFFLFYSHRSAYLLLYISLHTFLYALQFYCIFLTLYWLWLAQDCCKIKRSRDFICLWIEFTLFIVNRPA